MPRKKASNDKCGFRLRVILSPGFALGPGKADLLTGIQETGSISASGRRIGMSYKRAWSLVEELNDHFDQQVVTTAKGGTGGGGATLTPFGLNVLKRYRDIEAATAKAIAADVKALSRHLRDISDKK